MEFRDYQGAAIDSLLEEIESKSTALCVAPTGSGKTEIMIGLLQQYFKINQQASVVTLIKRINLVEQTSIRFNEAGLASSVYCGSLGSKALSQITVASIDSYHGVFDHKVNLLILDEVHNFNEEKEDSRYSQAISRLTEQGTKIIGFTATP